jgi:hypothetical protein
MMKEKTKNLTRQVRDALLAQPDTVLMEALRDSRTINYPDNWRKPYSQAICSSSNITVARRQHFASSGDGARANACSVLIPTPPPVLTANFAKQGQAI